MDYLVEFEKVMLEQSEIALATSVDNKPNVRIVNFYYDSNGKVLYFATFKDNRKVREIGLNDNVSFTTIPHSGEAHVRAISAVAKKSKNSIFDLKAEFISKEATYEDIIEQAGDQLELYEVHFKTALVAVDYTNIGEIEL